MSRAPRSAGRVGQAPTAVSAVVLGSGVAGLSAARAFCEGQSVAGVVPSVRALEVRWAAVGCKAAVTEVPSVAGVSQSEHWGHTAVLAGAAGLAAVAACRRRPRRTAAAGGSEASGNATTLPVVDRKTTKTVRMQLQKSDQYFKFGKTQMENAMNELRNISGSDILSKLRTNGFRMSIGDVTFVLAESYGFCWGVERAVAMAYEARNFFPDKNIWVTNEIIHNPLVNQNLTNMGIRFVKAAAGGGKDFSEVKQGDVVILPAFGASIDEMAYLKERQCQIVDTTCPWVSKVWNSVEKSKEKGHTAIIHGKYDHEETVATKSFAEKYLVLKNMDEAEYVAQYILRGGSKDEFMKKFTKAVPEEFDPEQDLVRVGVANQTTMLKGETELIGKLFERVMIKKYGPAEVNQHFVSFNTICDATQERQDAMYKMFGAEYEPPNSKLYADLEGEQVGIDLMSQKNAEKLSSRKMENELKGEASAAAAATQKIDLVLVVGGFNSSNTGHLVEIPQELGCPAYHIDCAERIGEPKGKATNRIQFKPLETPPMKAMMDEGLEVKENFLPSGPITIGVTSGASTPDSVVGECLQRVLQIRGLA